MSKLQKYKNIYKKRIVFFGGEMNTQQPIPPGFVNYFFLVGGGRRKGTVIYQAETYMKIILE